jgi:asparagine synthase (glutamine-hydrolysing)
MCGIAGIVCANSDEGIVAAVRTMNDAQRHRGPDGEGFFAGKSGGSGIVLGHLRLSIIDLSDAGRQPMSLPDGSGVIIFNGEIYNYKELRTELETLGAVFRTRTDTEVLLWALRLWGDEALSNLNGMWAFAWLDLRRGRLMLSRDRFGIKPLYYLWEAERFLFASEIKAILAASRGRFGINPEVAGRFVEQSVLDAQSETFFSGIKALPAGHSLILDLNDDGSAMRPSFSAHWSAPENDQFRGTVQERIEAVREIFVDAVKLRLRSDVPVGVLLSGGVDSSAIAAVMRILLGRSADLHLISATSENPAYDESPFIDLMVQYLGGQFKPIRLSKRPEEWLRLLDKVIYTNDEPVSGFSTVAHYLLMEQAKELGITVILSGQGADETLCGYRKFLGFRLRELLTAGRHLAAARTLLGFICNRTVVTQFDLSEAKRYLWVRRPPSGLDIRGPLLRDKSFILDLGLGEGTLVHRQFRDLGQLSVPALVHYEDRSSMAWSREIRLPFLDYRLVSVLLPADPELKLHAGWTKWIFRKAIEPYLPPAITWRKDKQPFINPQSQWLRRELRPAIERMLSGQMLIADAGLIDVQALRRRYNVYLNQSPTLGTVSFKDIFNSISMEIWARRFESYLALN